VRTAAEKSRRSPGLPLHRKQVSPRAPAAIASVKSSTQGGDSFGCTLVSFDRALPIAFSPAETFFLHFLVPAPASSARENAFKACTSGFTTFFTCFRLSLRQSASEAFTPALIKVLTVPAVTVAPG